MRIAVLSDTHAPRFWKACPRAVATQLECADLILHAGDICVPEVLDELAAFAPVQAVLGNNDGAEVAARGVRTTLEVDIEGVSIAMIHDSGPAQGRAARLRRVFPGAQLVVFGHSHVPFDAAENGQHLFNPGSPTDRRRQPRGTMGMLTLDGGRIVAVDLVPVT